MKLFKFIIISLISFNIFAAIPTVEGLFRNSSSGEILADTVVFTVMIENEINKSLLDATSQSEEPESSQMEKTLDLEPLKKYVKYIFNLKKPGRYELLQIEYSSPSMQRAAIERVQFIPNYTNRINADNNLERSVFNSLILSYGLNDSAGINTVLKRYNSDYKLNTEVMNNEKVSILKKYKEYLIQSKESETEDSDSLKSPLKPESEEEKARVDEILKSKMYIANDQVKLIRKNNKFHWRVQLENFEALFSNESHRLENFVLKIDEKNIEVTNSEFISFNGQYNLPREFYIKSAEQTVYRVRSLDIKVFNSKTTSMSDRVKDFNKYLAKNKESWDKDKKVEFHTLLY